MENEFELRDQEFTSKATAHGNGKANNGTGRVPALFVKIFKNIEPGDVLFDYGCGEETTVNKVHEFLATKNVIYYPWDKYNYNSDKSLNEIVAEVRKKYGGADIATCANVLNVIKEKSIRNDIIKHIYSILKPTGIACFDVYADAKKEGPKQTGSDKWQEFRSLDSYVQEIEEVFGDHAVTKQNGVLYARKSNSRRLEQLINKLKENNLPIAESLKTLFKKSTDNLEEKYNQQILYHATSAPAAKKILESDTLKVGRTYSNGNPAICLSRDFRFVDNGRFNVIFVIDKDGLTNNYKVTPISDNKNSFNGPKVARYQDGSKAEEVVYSDINDFSNYTLAVVVNDNIYDAFIEYIKPTVDISKINLIKKSAYAKDRYQESINESNQDLKNQLKQLQAIHKKKNKKRGSGWFVNPNAGNVEHNVEFFNKVMTEHPAQISTDSISTMSENLFKVVRDDTKNIILLGSKDICEEYIREASLTKEIKFSLESCDQVNSNIILEDLQVYDAISYVKGKDVFGTVKFYNTEKDNKVEVKVHIEKLEPNKTYGIHIHENGNCSGDASDAFKNVGMHYNPTHQRHPNHAGDLPPLMSDSKGIADYTFITDEFTIEDIVDKAVIVHSKRDDFTSAPAGDSGSKIACGVIESANKEFDINEEIEIHDELNPKLWNNYELNSEIRDKIKAIVNQYVDNLKENNINIKVKDIVLLGSNVNYNYTDASDLDIHIVADTSISDCEEDHLSQIYDAYRTIFNNRYDITLNDIPVEIYVETDTVGANSNGIYSINNGWIKKPEKENLPEINQEEVNKKVDFWKERYYNIIDTDSEKKTNKEKLDAIYSLIDDLYKDRQESIQKDGEFGLDNLAFKEFRNNGYLDDLKELRDELVSNDLSLTEDSDIEKFLEAKLKDEANQQAARYRSLVGLNPEDKITEDNLQKWAFNQVGVEYMIDEYLLKENLFNN